MAEPPPLRPQSFEILATRELRKAGFDVGQLRMHRRSELPEPESGFVVELVVPLSEPRTAWSRRTLVVCRKQSRAVERDVIDSVKARLSEADADVGLVVATADFTEGALAAAREHGIALLRVVDSRTAVDTSGWSTPGHYPAWLPAYVAQVIDRDIAGQPRARLLEAGGTDMILDSMRIESSK